MSVSLNEMQFGKLNALLAIEDLLDRLRLKYKKKDSSTNVKHFREIIKDDALKKIAKYITSTFGFNETAVTLYRDPISNAYTIAFPKDKNGKAVYNKDNKQVTDKKFRASVIISNTGFSYDIKSFPTNFLVCISTGLMFDYRITSGEIVAILLHEIGHQFSKVILNQKELTPRADEGFADQFAAMYGYGVEFTSVMQKMHSMRDPKSLKAKMVNIPLINIIVGTFDLALNLYVREIRKDEHPGLKRRLDSQIEQMESDLKDYNGILSADMKDELRAKIEQCKKMNDSFFNTHDNMYDRMTKWYWNRIEPELPANKNMDVFARKGTDPDKLNTQLGNMYKKRGYFKK